MNATSPRSKNDIKLDAEHYYRKYGPMVLRRCRAMLKDEDNALDAMQDTFVQLLRYGKRMKAHAPSSLLYRMATNICLNKIRSEGYRRPAGGDDLLSQIATLEEPDAPFLAKNLLNRLFSNQKASTKTIAVLYLLDGMTLEEVAREVGMSVSGVRKRLCPLKDQLEILQQAAA